MTQRSPMPDADGVLETSEELRINGLVYALHRYRGPSLARTDEGAPSRKTLLLLHGFLDAGSTFDLVARPLALAGYDVIAPDLRGFGESERIGAGGYYHFPDYVADVDDLVERLAPTWLGVVGHSMGGGVATLYAGARPDRVQRLVVMEGLGPMSDLPNLAVDRMRRWLDDRRKIERSPRAMRDLDEATRKLAAAHPRLPEPLLRSRAERLVRPHPEGGLRWAWDPLHRTTTPTPFDARAYVSFLRAITCPALFVGGGDHGWHPPDEDERLAAFTSLSRFDVPDAGHMMHWTAPEPVAAAILAFLRRDDAAAGGADPPPTVP